VTETSETSETSLSNYSAAQIRFALQLALYRKDFYLFARDHLMVRPKQVVGRPLVPFNLNLAQKRINDIAEEQYKEEGWVRLCILKARQPGISTWSAARSFHMAALNEYVASMTIAHDEETANHVFNIIRIFYEHLPRQFKPNTRYDRRGELVFAAKNASGDTIAGSRMHCQTARNAMSGTGHTLQSLHMSEASKYNQPEHLWTSINPSVPDMPDTSIILESTAHVNGEWFRAFCNQTQEGANKFRFIFIPWFWVDEYRLKVPRGKRLRMTTEEKFWNKEYGLSREQIYWYRMKIEDYGGDTIARELMAQEYPFTAEGAWVNLSLSVFEPRKVQELHAQVYPAPQRSVVMPGPRILEAQDGELHIWETPKAGRQYDIGVDVATGVEYGDWSVACVLDRQERKQVAEWHGHIDPILFGEVVYWLGTYYNTAQVAVEITGIGFATNDILVKKGYPYVYIWRQRGEIVPRLSHFAGWKTSRDSKSYLVSLAKHYIMRGEVTIRSPILWQEMRTFAMKGQDEYGAAPGFNDDCVIAWLIAIAAGDDEMTDMVQLTPEERLEKIDPALVDDFDWGGVRSGNPLVALKEELGM
jgi:hypothetical protein